MEAEPKQMDDREELLKIVRDITRTRRPITDSTCLHHDLSLFGEDAAELLERGHKTFGTSFEGFEFDSYFPDEVDGHFYHLAKMFGFKSKKKRLSVGHLLAAIKAGPWCKETE